MPRRQRRPTRAVTTPILHPHAAGVDVGATELYVCVPLDRDPRPIRWFGTFPEDLRALADWLQTCGVTTVAMESTGVYWIPLYQMVNLPLDRPIRAHIAGSGSCPSSARILPRRCSSRSRVPRDAGWVS